MNTKIASVSVSNISSDRQQTVLSFRGDLECNQNALEESNQTIFDKILKKLFSIKVIEEIASWILRSNAIDLSNSDYVENIIIEPKFLLTKPLEYNQNFTSDAVDDTELKNTKKSTLVEQRLITEHHITQVKQLPLSEYPQQIKLFYRSNSIIELEGIHKTIIGKILSERNVIVVTKDDQLLDLLSDAVEDTDLSYIKQNAVKIKSFLPEPESTVKHHATLVKNFPLSAAEDLACSSEFTFGNLWFLIPSDDTNIDQCDNDVISDIKKLSTYIIDELPRLKNEAVALPAMYDGLEILWFKPDHDVFRKKVCGSTTTFLNGTQ